MMKPRQALISFSLVLCLTTLALHVRATGEKAFTGSTGTQNLHATSTDLQPLDQPFVTGAWFKTSQTAKQMGINLQQAMDETGINNGFALQMQSGGAIRFIYHGYNSGVLCSATTTGTFADNNWHFAVGYRDEKDVCRVSVDGALTGNNFAAADASTPAGADYNIKWERRVCANEGGTCQGCTGTIYYGRRYANGKPGSGDLTTFAQLKETGFSTQANPSGNNVACTNAIFGDPLNGYYKHCLCEFTINTQFRAGANAWEGNTAFHFYQMWYDPPNYLYQYAARRRYVPRNTNLAASTNKFYVFYSDGTLDGSNNLASDYGFAGASAITGFTSANLASADYPVSGGLETIPADIASSKKQFYNANAGVVMVQKITNTLPFLSAAFTIELTFMMENDDTSAKDWYLWTGTDAVSSRAFAIGVKQITVANQHQVFFQYGTASSSCIVSAELLSKNMAYHIAGSYDGTTAKLYINGVQTVASGSLGCATLSTSIHGMGFGYNGASADVYGPKKTYLNQIRYWTRARSQQEIAAAMDVWTQPAHPDLAYLFDFQSDTVPSSGQYTLVNSGSSSYTTDGLHTSNAAGWVQITTSATDRPYLVATRAPTNAISAVAPVYIACNTPQLTLTGASTGATKMVAFAPDGQCASTSRTGHTSLSASASPTLASSVTAVGVHKLCYSIDGGVSWSQQTGPSITFGEDMTSSTATAPNTITTDAYTVDITALLHGNPHTLSCANRKFRCSWANGLTGTTDAQQVGATNTYRCTRATTTPGTFQVTIEFFDGTSYSAIQNNVKAFTISVGPVSPAQCTVASTYNQPITAGQTRSFDIVSKDAYGNTRATITSDVFQVRLSPNDGAPADLLMTATSQGNGVYQGSYTPTSAETYNATISIAGQLVATSAVTVNPAAIHVPSCSFTTSATTISAGDSVTIQITAVDQYNNLITDLGADAFRATWTGTGGTQAQNTPFASGNYSIQTSALQTKGSFTLAVTHIQSAQSLPGSPVNSFQVNPAPLNAAASTYTGSTTVTNGQPASFQIVARDQYNNILDGHSLTPACSFTGSITGSTSNNASPGTYDCNYTPAVPATTYTVTLSLNGNTVSGNTFTLTVVPGPNNNTKALVYFDHPLRLTHAGRGAQLWIQTRDLTANNRTTHDVPFVVSLQHASLPSLSLSPPTVTDPAPGRYHISFNATVAGAYSLSITNAAVHVADSPYTFSVLPSHSHGPSSGLFNGSLPSSVITAGDQWPSYLLQPRDRFLNNITTPPLNCHFYKDDLSSTDNVLSATAFPMPTDAVSVSFWIKPGERPSANMSALSYSSSSQAHALVCKFRSDAILMCLGDNACVAYTLSLGDAFKSWHHLVYTWARSDGNVYLYLDGVALTPAGLLATTDAIASPGTLHIARQSTSTSQQAPAYDNNAVFDGWLDDIALWQARLDPSTARQLMAAPLQGDEPSLWALWNFDDCATSPVRDASGQARHLTATGAVLTTGASLRMHGKDGDLTTASRGGGAQVPTSKLTIGAWIKATSDFPSGAKAIVLGYSTSVYVDELNFEVGLTKCGIEWGPAGKTGDLTDVTIDVGVWNHIAVTVDNSDGRVVFYKDGAVVSNALYASGGSKIKDVTLRTANGAIVLGCDQDAQEGNYQNNECIDGLLTQVFLLDGAKPQSHIQQYMRYGVAPDEAGLYAYYTMENQLGAMVYDLSPFQQHLRVKTGSTWAFVAGVDPPKRANGLRYSVSVTPALHTAFVATQATLPPIHSVQVSGGNATEAKSYSLSLIDKSRFSEPALGTPRAINVLPAPAHGPLCTAVGPGLDAVVAGAPSYVVLTARDRFANKHTDNAETVSGSLTTAGITPVDATITTEAAGEYRAAYTLTYAASYQFSLTIRGQAALGFPRTVSVTPGAAVPANSLSTGSGLTDAVAGFPAYIDITVRDAHNNRLTTTSSSVVATLTKTGLADINAAASNPSGGGLYRMTYTATKAGPYNMAVTVQGTAIPGSPFTVNVAPQADPVAANTVVSGAGATGGTAGVQATFIVDLRDQFLNVLATSTATVVSSLSTPTVAVAVTPNTNGRYTLTYTAQQARTYSMALSVNGNAFGQTISPVIVAGPAKASQTTILDGSGGGDSAAVAGTPASFTIQAKDQFDNPRTVETDNFFANLTHSSGALAPIAAAVTPGSAASGQYQVQYTVTVTGSYTLAIGLDAQVGLTRTVAVSPGPAQLTNFVALGGLLYSGQPTVAGQTSTFSVQCKDVYNNNRTSFDPISVAVPHKTIAGRAANAIAIANGPVASGQRTVSYQATVSGQYNILVTNGASLHIVSSPFTVTVLPSTIAAATTQLSGVTNTVAGSQGSIAIQARDQYNNDLTSGGSAFVLSINHNALAGVQAAGLTQNDQGNGAYAVLFNATLAGAYTISAFFNGDPILGSGSTLTVVPAATYGPRCTLVNPPATATAGVHVVYQVQARDAFGNARTQAGDSLAVTSTRTGGGTHADQSITADPGASGTYTVRTNYTLAGLWAATVRVDGLQVQGSPVAVSVANNIAYGQTSSVAQPASAALAGTSVTWQMQVRDAYGNTRSQNGDSLQVTLTHATQAIPPITGAVANVAAGLYSTTYPVTRAGHYNVQVLVNGMSFGNSPFTTQVLPTNTSVSDSVAYGQALSSVVAGAQGTFTLQARDRFHNNRSLTTDSFAAYAVLSANPAVRVNATVAPHGSIPGAYAVDYNATVSGNYVLHVHQANTTGANIHISGSPFAMQCLPASLHIPSTTVDTKAWGALSAAEVNVQSRDAFGNLRSIGAVDSFDLRVFFEGSELNVVAKTPSSGLYPFEYTAPRAGTVNVTVTTGGQIVGASQWSVIQAFGPANYSFLLPPLGPQTGNTRITITGTNFVDTPKMLARVGGVDCASVSYISGTQIVCTTAAVSTGSKDLVVTNNAYVNTSAANVPFLVHPQLVVSSFEPNNGPVYGRTPVTVRGTGFINNPLLACKFGDVINSVAPEFVSTTEILCTSPENIVGDLVVSVANNRQNFVPAVAAAGFFKYIEPFSPLCRLATELPVGKLEREAKGQLYFPNLAAAASINASAGSDGVDFRTGLYGINDNDRCCEKTVANQGKFCGIKFAQQFTSNMTDLASVIVALPRQAFVNEFVTSWFRPCANQPAYYYIDYDVSGNGTWVPLLTRITKSDAISLGTQKPCFFVPSDQEDASICIDFLSAELRATHFRMRFNNTEGVMGKFGTTTDGAWLFEFEVHGVYTDTPEYLDLTRDLSTWPAQQTLASVPVPPVTLRTLNHQREPLLSQDTATQSVTVRLLRTDTMADVSTTYLSGTRTVALVAGVANFTDLTLNALPVNHYRLAFSSDNGLVEVHTNFSMIIGPAHSLKRTSAAAQTAASAAQTSISAVQLRLYDVSDVLVGATDGNRNVSVALSGQPSGNPNPGAVLSGPSHFNMSQGSLAITGLSLVKPVPGLYNLTFAMVQPLNGGTTSVQLAVTVTSGPPHSLALVTTISGTYPSASTVLINTVAVQVLDISGTLTKETFGWPVAITPVSLNASLPIIGAGAAGCTAVDGQCSIAGMRVAKPAQGTYLVAFRSYNVLNVTAQLQVTIGAAVELRLRTGQSQTHPSAAQVLLDSIVVDAYDIGANFVGATDTTRAVSIATLNTTSLALTGSLGGSMSAGTVSFANIRLLKPAVGLYVIRASSAGLTSVDSLITVTVGAPTQLRVVSDAAVVVETFTDVVVPNITVQALDAGGVFVGASDTQNRTVTASVSPSGSGLVSSTAVAHMINGQLIFSGIQLKAPLVQNYTLTLSSTNLTSVEMVLAVQSGNPVSLKVAPLSLGPYGSANLVKIANVTLSLLDAGNTVVNNDRAASKVARLYTVLSNTTAVVQGTTSIVMDTASVVFHNVSLFRPKANEYTMVLGVEGLPNATVAVRIDIGAPYSLRLVSDASVTLPTRPSVNLPNQRIEVLDIGGSRVPAATDLIVNVSTSVPLQGIATRRTFAGLVDFPGLQMAKPPNQTYTLTYVCAGLVSTTSAVIITPGPPHALASAQSVLGPLPSTARVSVHAGLVLSVLDTANNVVPDQYADTRDVTVSQVSGPENGVLEGSLAVSLVNASQATFSNMSLVAPSVGNYTLRFTSSGLLSVDVLVRIETGPAVTLRVISPAAVSAQTQATLVVPDVELRAFDAGNTFVGATDASQRNVAVSVDNNGVLSGNTSVVMSNGHALLRGLSFSFAPRGTYTLTFSSSGLTNVTLTATIGAGNAYKLSSVSVANTQVQSLASSLFGAISLSTLDAGGGVTSLGNAGRNVTVSINDTSQSVVGSTTVNVDGAGLVTFTNLGLASPRVGVYLLTFSSPGLANSPTAVVRVITGPPASLILAPGTQPPSLRTVAATVLPAIQLRSLDIGGNPVTVDGARAVFASVGNGTEGEPIATIAQGAQATMLNGNATFGGITLTSPVANTYVISFVSTGLEPAQLEVRVSIGPAVSLQVVQPAQVSFQSVVNLQLPSFVVRAVDSASVAVGNTDSPSTRAVHLYSPSARVLGQATFVMQNGVATIANVNISRPPVGSYALHLSSPGLLNATVAFQVTLGQAIEQRVEVGDSQVIPSSIHTTFANITIAAYEAGGAPVNAADGQVRDVLAVSPSLALAGPVVQQMRNGRLHFSGLQAVRPVQGLHTVVFVTAGLSNTSIQVNITEGQPTQLAVVPYTTTPHPTAVTVDLDAITVRVLDAGGKPTRLGAGKQLQVTAQPAVPLSGTKVVAIEGSEATFSSLQLQAPSSEASPFVLEFVGLAGLSVTKDSTQVHVRIGAPVRIALAAGLDQRLYPSADPLTVVDFELRLLDAAGVFVGTSDAANVRSVNGTKLNGTLSANLPASLHLRNGSVVVSGMTLTRPRVGTYLFTFASGSLATVQAQVRVGVGQPHAWTETSQSANKQLPASRVVFVGAVNLAMVDIGGNLLGVADQAQRRVEVTLASSPGSFDRENDAFVPLSWQGTRTVFSSVGVVQFADLQLTRPVRGVHVLRFSSQGIQSTDVALNVTTGFPEQVVLDGNATRTVSYTGSANLGVLLSPPVNLQIVDAGRGVVPGVAVTRVTVSGSVHRVSTSNSNNQKLGNDATVMIGGTLARDLVGGLVTFDDLLVNAVEGPYIVTFSPRGFGAVDVQVHVLAGPAASFVLVNNGTTSYRNTGPMPSPPTFRLLDRAGNQANRTGVALAIAVSPSVRQLQGDAQTSDQNGVVRFTALQFQGRWGFTYSYTVSSTPNIGTLSMPGAVRVITCAEDVRANTEPDESGYQCRCRPGYFSVSETSPCTPCPESSYQQLRGQVECNACPPFMDTEGQEAAVSQAQCTCVDGFYERSVNGQRTCLKCTLGAVCTQAGGIQAQRGFFGIRAGTDQYIACPYPDACKGGPNSTCATGYRGPLCAVCEDGYGKLGEACLICGEDSDNWTLVVLFFTAATAMLLFLIRTSTGEKSQASIMMKIALNYMQVLAFIGEFRLNWAAETQGLFSSGGVALFSLRLHPIDCATGWTYFDQLNGYMMFPVFTIFAPLVVYGAVYLWATRISKHFGIKVARPNLEIERETLRVTSEDDRDRLLDRMKERMERGKEALQTREKLPYNKAWRYHLRNMYALTLMVVLFIAHPMVSKAVFQMFNCITLEDGSRYLEADMRINCASDQYLYYLNTWGYLFVLVYCLGVLLVGLGILVKNRKRLRQPTVMARYRFLYDGYSKNRYFWEIVIMTRKLMVVAIIVRWSDEPLTQLYAGLWMCMAALVMHLYARPFAEAEATRLETMSLGATTVTLMTGLMFYSSETTEDDHWLISIVLLVLNSVTLAFLGVVIVREFIKIARSKKIVKEMEANLAKQLEERRIHNEQMAERAKVLGMFEESERVKKAAKARGMTSVVTMDDRVRRSTHAEIVQQLVAASDKGPKNIAHALESLEHVLDEPALRSRYFRFADTFYGNGGAGQDVLSDTLQGLWLGVRRYHNIVHDRPNAEEEVADAANSVVEEYLDEDAEECVEVEYGLLVDILRRLGNHELNDKLFDGVVLEHFQHPLTEFQKGMNDLRDGPSVEDRVESVTATMSDNILRTKFVKYVLRHAIGHEKSELDFLRAARAYRDGFAQWTTDKRMDEMNEVVGRFFDEDEDEYLDMIEYGVLVEQSHRLGRVDEAHPDAFDETVRVLFVNEFVEWRKEVLTLGELALL